jgi:hypothetical protein
MGRKNTTSKWPHNEDALQNQSLRYATHQLINAMGMVASSPQMSGSAKSATRLRTMKTIQKIFFCNRLLLLRHDT